jgi:hypothetical protein
MLKLYTVGDPTKTQDTPGNLLTLTAELIPSSNLREGGKIAFSMGVNDGTDDQPATEMYVELLEEQIIEMVTGLQKLLNEQSEQKVKLLADALDFKTAQMACVLGQIGSIEIVKVADSDHGNVVSFGIYTVLYKDDTGDDVVLHSLDNVEMYVPFAQEEQFEWLRSLVGGNHQFTSTIKVKLTGFTLDEVAAKFGANLRTAVK